MNTIAAFGNDRVLAVSVLRERLIGLFEQENEQTEQTEQTEQAKHSFKRAIGAIGGSLSNRLIDINNGVATLLV